MAKLYDKEGSPIYDVAFLNEGTMTVAEGRTSRGVEEVATPASPCAKGDLVVPAGLTSDGIIIVQKRATTDVRPIGELATNPVGKKPASTKTWGNYDPYRADIRFFASAIKMRTVTTGAGETIAAGDSVKPSTTAVNKFVKDTTANNTVCLAAVAESSEVLVPVLEMAAGF
jgi:hypothetical protein